MRAPAPRLFGRLSRSILCLCAGLSAAALAGAAAAPPNIGIDKRPVHLERKTFPPGRPPPHPFYNPREEAAFCASQFGCVCDVGAEGWSPPRPQEPAILSRVNLTLTLEITVWTPKGGPRGYVLHEEHHRAISEHYYRDAEAIARRVVERELAQLPPLPPTHPREPLDRALRALQRRLMDAYLKETHERASYAQDRFDAITDHGRAAVSNASAFAQALSEEEAHWATLQPRP